MLKSWEKDRNSKTFNEFYTLYKNCELIFRDLLSIIEKQTKNNSKLTVCCPCDSEKSNIVKWLQDNTDWNIIYFGDKDVNGEEARNIMLEADVIITNPPFSMRVWRPFMTWLIANKKNFFIFGPILQSNCLSLAKLVYEHSYVYTIPSHKAIMWEYETLNDGHQYANTLFYTCYDVPYLDYEYKQPTEHIETYEGIPVYNRTNAIPKDYKGWMYVPCTSIRYIKHFELDDTKLRVPGKFTRYCIRRI
jgi:hypothetical protein